MKNKLITIILSLMIMALPLAIMPGAHIYNTPKVYVLLTGGALLLVMLILNKKNFNFDKKDYLMIAFAVIIFLSSMFSGHIKRTIIGNTNRHEGLLALYTYIVIYFCAKKFLKYKNNRTLLIILHLVYIAVALVGIAQKYVKVDTLELYPIFRKGVCGTLGNTNFMGSFISMGIPIFIIMFILKGNLISLATSLLLFWNLISCQARSGWVAFIVFAIMLVIYLIKNRKLKYIIRTILLIICFSAIFNNIYKQDNYVKNKIKIVKKEVGIIQEQIKNDDEKTEEKVTEQNTQKENEKSKQSVVKSLGSGRLQIWKIVIELIPKYPILGVGPDNLQNGIIENITETSLDFIERTKTMLDKAHNEYLQIAVTLGVPALIIYLVFLGSIIIPKVKDTFCRENTFIINSAIISYMVQAFFNISTIGVAPLFWFALGVADNETINCNSEQSKRNHSNLIKKLLQKKR